MLFSFIEWYVYLRQSCTSILCTEELIIVLLYLSADFRNHSIKRTGFIDREMTGFDHYQMMGFDRY